MKIGDTVHLRGYHKQVATVVQTWEFPDATRRQMCKVSKRLRGNMQVSDTWRASELVLVRAAQGEGASRT